MVRETAVLATSNVPDLELSEVLAASDIAVGVVPVVWPVVQMRASRVLSLGSRKECGISGGGFVMHSIP